MSQNYQATDSSLTEASTHNHNKVALYALIDRIGNRLLERGFSDGREIASEFFKTVQVEIVPVAEMQSELARIVDMAQDHELQAKFSGFLKAPLVTDTQRKAAYQELRNAFHFPPIDQPDIMRAWVRVIHAAKTQWDPEQSDKIEDFSHKLMLYFLDWQKKVEHRRDLEHMSEGIITEKLEVFFHDIEAPPQSAHSRNGV